MQPLFRNILISATVTVATVTMALAVGLAPTQAWAGPEQEEIWFGTGVDSLEVGENGQVTAAGAKTKTDEVDRIPGEEDWELKLHTKMGKYAAEGPVYIEFYQSVQDKEYIVYRHEDADYDGARNYTAVILLEANIGFNKDRQYRVQIVQNNGKRDLILAKGKVTLIDTGRKAEGEDEEAAGEEAEEAGDEEEVAEDEDEDEDDDEGGESEEAPPPIDDSPAKKKGCSVTDGGATDLGATGLGILLLAATIRRRRRD
jgi:MYXO-CTERM domain-containing protein